MSLQQHQRTKTMETNDCEVYVIAKCPKVDAVWGDLQFERPCKVGITQNSSARLTQVQTSCPFKVSIAWSFMFLDRRTAEVVERTFHLDQRLHRLNGEWFDIDHLHAIHRLCSIARSVIYKDEHFDDYLDFSSVLCAEHRFGFKEFCL